MTRVKRGTQNIRKRKSILSRVKGYKWGRSKKLRQAKEAMFHAGLHSFQHRRKKKGEFRKLWQIRISSIAKAEGISYSKLIHSLKKNSSNLNRKVMSDLAKDNPDVFKRVINSQKNS